MIYNKSECLNALSLRPQSPSTPAETRSWDVCFFLFIFFIAGCCIISPLLPIIPSISIHTGFPDVACSQNHNLHRLVGHTVHQGILRNGDQQKVARAAAAAVHGSWRRVASQPHLASLGQRNPVKKGFIPTNFRNDPARGAT